jgi:tRNA-dihydrouridine synthase B
MPNASSATKHNNLSGLPIAPDAPWLAPLAGWSDIAFRILCRENGAAAACTEMVSAKGLCYGGRGSEVLLVTTPKDSPLVVQLFGREPEYLAKSVRILVERGFKYFDLNSGCSVRKVAKTGSGAALMYEPDALIEAVRAMIDAADGRPVGVKFRLGWEDRETYLHVGEGLEKLGAAWLTLHPRTAKMGFTGHADWSALAKLKQNVGIPVIGSGDLMRAEDGVRMIEETGIDGLMFARGATRDPSIFKRYTAMLSGRSPEPTDMQEMAALIRRHAELARIEHFSINALLKMRTIVPRYVRNFDGAGNLRKELVQIRTWEAFDEAMNAFFGPEPLPGSQINNGASVPRTPTVRVE